MPEFTRERKVLAVKSRKILPSCLLRVRPLLPFIRKRNFLHWLRCPVSYLLSLFLPLRKASADDRRTNKGFRHDSNAWRIEAIFPTRDWTTWALNPIHIRDFPSSYSTGSWSNPVIGMASIKIPFLEEAANLSPSPDHRTNQSTLTWTSHLPHLIQLESGKEATWTHPSAGSPMEHLGNDEGQSKTPNMRPTKEVPTLMMRHNRISFLR